MNEREQLRLKFAQEIKSARLAKGWSVYRLSKEAKVPAPTLFAIEAGKHTIRTDILQRLCKTLALRIEFPVRLD